MTDERQTFPVDEELFREVYDSPGSLPGCHKWVTCDDDVRRLEELLGMPRKTIGAPLWVSGDHKCCPKCGREVNWLDIVSSALEQKHGRDMIAAVILGERKYVNTEAPRAIAGVRCFDCQTDISDLRSFKCHNWAYAVGKLADVIRNLGIAAR